MSESTGLSGLFFPLHDVALPLVDNDLPLPVTVPKQIGAHQGRSALHGGQEPPPQVPPSPADSRVKPARYFRIKPLVDRILTLILLVVTLPLMVAIGLAILFTEGRPIFFRQTRVGKHGRTFRIWKFRTMCNDAERISGAVWSHASDPRVTSLGRWLRCSHLDELPQLFNVLVGDMNLIGPRPERPEFVRELALELPFYEQRLAARPGITGLAQLRLDYDQSLAQVRDKVILDLEYIQSTSLLRDAALLAGTLPHVLKKLRRKWLSDRQSPFPAHRRDHNFAIRVGISPADISPSLRSIPVTAFPHFNEAVSLPDATATPTFAVSHSAHQPAEV